MSLKQFEDEKDIRCDQIAAALLLDLTAAITQISSRHGMLPNLRQASDGTHIWTVHTAHYTQRFEDWEIVINLAPTKQESKQLLFSFMQEASDEADSD